MTSTGVCASVMIGWLTWATHRMLYNAADSHFFFSLDENLSSLMTKKNVYPIWYASYHLICGMEFHVCFEFSEITIFSPIFCKISMMCWLFFFLRLFFRLSFSMRFHISHVKKSSLGSRQFCRCYTKWLTNVWNLEVPINIYTKKYIYQKKWIKNP